MMNWGAVPAGAVLPFVFASYGKTNGESITLTGLAVTDIEVYKGTSMTQRASDAGFTLLDTDGIDIDATTGIHGFSIDTGDNTDAGFFAAGSYYWVIVSAVTVDSQTVSFIAGTFRLVAAESVSGTPKADVSHFGGTAGTFSSGRAEVNTSHVAGTAQTAGDIIADTNDIQARLPAALVSGRIDASVGAMASGVLTATAIAADAITDAKVASDVTIASVTGAVGSVTGAVGSIGTGGITAASFAAGAIDAAAIAADAIGSSELAASAITEIQAGLSTLTAAQVNAEVVDALATDTYAEPGQGAPAATATLAAKINYLYKAWRNKKTQTATTLSLFADDATTVDQKATVSDDGTTTTVGEVATGP